MRYISVFILIIAAGIGVWYALRSMQAPPAAVAPASKDDLITVVDPLPQASIQSPLTVSGKARGPWYFEAQFPVKIYDGRGVLLGSSPALARSEWMTQEYVPFSAEVSFSQSTTATGTLVLEKDNPSGRPEAADQLVIPIRFASPATSPSPGEMSIKLYYYDPLRDQGPGGAQCSAQGLVAVERTIPRTQTPLIDSIRLLLRGELSDTETQQGLMAEFPLEGVALAKATITGGIATLTFVDPQGKTSGGSCRVSIMRAQIEATAKQFPSVLSVRLEPQDIFQP